MNAHFVIVGAGLAGAKTAEHLRSAGFDGRLTLVGEEALRPYNRPPLSKGVLSGSDDVESVFVHPTQWYSDHDVDLRTETAATALDLQAHSLTLSDGSQLAFDKLALTTGATPRPLHVTGSDLPGIHYLRRLPDAQALRAALGGAQRLAIAGGGWIGLEVAAAARTAGLDVTVVEAAALPLLSVLGARMATVFADLHRARGVDLRLGVGVDGFEGEQRVRGMRLSNGEVVQADAVVVGIGVVPNVGLAQAAGLAVDNGIVADQHLQTSHPDVVAAGDVVNAYHPFLDRHLRVEHWANALNQPTVAAATMLGQPASYERLPYFYSDQYDLGMEYLGHSGPDADVVVRGDEQAREFIAFWLGDGRVQAGMNVNVWDVVDDVRELITSGRRVDPARLSDPAIPLQEV